MTQFQGALLQEQLKRLEQQARRREANAAYLDELLSQVPGIRPKKKLDGTTRRGCFLYVFDYEPDKFAGMGKTRFRRAVAAEGVPVSPGYAAINKQPWVERFLGSRGYRRIYGQRRLRQWRDANVLPANDQMIQTTCRLSQTILLADREEMEHVAAAMARVQKHAAAIAQSG